MLGRIKNTENYERKVREIKSGLFLSGKKLRKEDTYGIPAYIQI
jgi:hypothetical protein